MIIDLIDDSEESKSVKGKKRDYTHYELIDITEDASHSSNQFLLKNIKGEENYDSDNNFGSLKECSTNNFNQQHYNTYKPIIDDANYSNPDNAICDVCLVYNGEDGDDIVFCDICYSAVHQSCYGSELLEKIPEGEWICQRCRCLKEENKQPNQIRCFFCPEMKGIIKNVIPQKNLGIKSKIWAHVSCVNWIKEIYYIDDLKETAHFDYDRNRFGKECKICESILGSCIQCDFKNCYVNFHVTCAQRFGLILPDEEMKIYQIEDYYYPVFCPNHKEKIDNVLNENPEDEKQVINQHIKRIKFYNSNKETTKTKSKKSYKKKSKTNKKIPKKQPKQTKQPSITSAKQSRKSNNSLKTNIIQIHDISLLSRKKVFSEYLSENESLFSMEKGNNNVSMYQSDYSSVFSSKKKRKKKKKERVITMKLDKPKRNNKTKKKVIENNDSNKISFITDVWKKDDPKANSNKQMLFDSLEIYRLPHIFCKVLGFKKEISMTLNECYDKFVNFMIKSDSYDKKNDYILLYKHTELNEVFKEVFISGIDFKYNLAEILIKYNTELPQVVDRKTEKKLLIESSSDSDDDYSEEDMLNITNKGGNDVGWNLGNEETKIDFSNIHSSKIIVGRNFFIKNEQLLTFKLENCINLCYETDNY